MRRKLTEIWRQTDVLQTTIFAFIAWLCIIWGWKLARRQTMIELNATESLVGVSLNAVSGDASFVPGGIGVSKVSTAQTLTLM